MSNARLIMLIFFLQPLAFGAWLPQIPRVQLALGLGPAELAVALLGLPVGTLLTLPFAGRLAGWIGAKATIFYGFIAYGLIVSLPTWAPDQARLFISLMLAGSAISTLELGLNVAADEIEKMGSRFIMSTCHGFWSLGIMAGSVLGSVLAGLAVPPPAIVLGTAILVLPVALATAIRLPQMSSHAGAPRPPGIPFRPPSPYLLGVCLFVFGICMTEGAVADWSAIFLRDTFGALPGEAGLTYSVFALMVAAGRFSGDRLKTRFGAVVLARSCGALAIAGVLVIYLAPASLVAFAGFALLGVGVSVGFPLGVTAAADIGDRPASANVAILSFMALAGFLVGPPMIGFVTEYTGIRNGLVTLLPMLVVSLACAGFLRRRAPRPVMAGE